MNPKMTIAVIALVIAGIFYFGLAGTGSIITVMNDGKVLPPDTGVFQFAGVQGTYETVKLGCLTSGTHYVLNEENDGGTTICNSIDASQKLTLSSKLKSNGRGTNYIEAKILLPAGTGKASYNYDLSEYLPGSVEIFFKIDNHDLKFTTGATSKGSSYSGLGEYEFVLTEPKEVTFRIDTQTTSKKESSSGTLVIEFSPTQSTSLPSSPSTQPGQYSLVKSTKTLTEKINDWFQNIFSWIGGLFR